jgi:hypothetical protein
LAFTTTTGAGGTSLIGTSGVDTATLAGNSFPLYIGAQASNDVIVSTANITSVRAELGKGADSFTATGVATSTVSGNFGNDLITITGTVTGSTALINGNQGADSIALTGSTITKSARVLGGADNDTIAVGTANITQGGVVNGNKGSDTITFGAGTISNSTIFGGEGNDTMSATTAAVVFSGDKGDDTITGSSAADSLFGGDGNDLVSASDVTTVRIDAVRDTLSGGSGVDTFKAVGNTAATATGAINAAGALADIITDFSVSEDKINVGATGTAITFGGASQDGVLATVGAIYAISGTLSSDGTSFTQQTIAAGGYDTLIAIAAAGNTVNGATTTATGVLAVLDDVLATSVTNTNFVVG